MAQAGFCWSKLQVSALSGQIRSYSYTGALDIFDGSLHTLLSATAGALSERATIQCCIGSWMYKIDVPMPAVTLPDLESRPCMISLHGSASLSLH